LITSFSLKFLKIWCGQASFIIFQKHNSNPKLITATNYILALKPLANPCSSFCKKVISLAHSWLLSRVSDCFIRVFWSDVTGVCGRWHETVNQVSLTLHATLTMTVISFSDDNNCIKWSSVIYWTSRAHTLAILLLLLSTTNALKCLIEPSTHVSTVWYSLFVLEGVHLLCEIPLAIIYIINWLEHWIYIFLCGSVVSITDSHV